MTAKPTPPRFPTNPGVCRPIGLAFLFLLLPLAGCAAQDASDSSTLSTVSGPLGQDPSAKNETFVLQRLQKTIPLVIGPTDKTANNLQNCAFVQPAATRQEPGFRVLSVNATLTWTPQTPQSEYLVLVIQSGNATSQGYVRYDSPSAKSPVSMAMTYPFQDDPVMFMTVGARIPGLTQFYVQQPVDLTIDVTFESPLTDPQARVGTCGYYL